MKTPHFSIGEGHPLCILSGPCVIESEDHTLFCAQELKKLLSLFSFSFIFKASYDKANRSSIDSYRGPGLDEGLRILEKVKSEFDIPVVTDIHSPEEASAVASVVDMLQIPAFLCRQTDLLVAAAKTKKPIQIKKGQFVSPWDMRYPIEKVRLSGNDQILVTDRGTTFGYNNLVSDMRAIPIIQSFDVPVCFDGSHSTQLPGGGKETGGQRQFIPTLTKAAVAAGADAVYIETHPTPEKAMCDSTTVMGYKEFQSLLFSLEAIYSVLREKNHGFQAHTKNTTC